MSNQDTCIPLNAYAAVIAGLGAGLDLGRALAHAGVAPSIWEKASTEWQARIDESAASDLAVLVAFDAALIAAKPRFGPVHEPIASDARAWTQFRRHFLMAADPPAFLAEHDLTLSTYARLELEWTNRALAEKTLARELQEHMAAPLEACPKIVVTPSPLLKAITAELPADIIARAREAAAAPTAGAQRELPSFMLAAQAKPGQGAPSLDAMADETQPFHEASSSLRRLATAVQEGIAPLWPPVRSDPSPHGDFASPPSSAPATEPQPSVLPGDPVLPFKPPVEPAAAAPTRPTAVTPTEAARPVTATTAVDPSQTIAALLVAGTRNVLPFAKDPSGIGDAVQTIAAPLGTIARDALPFAKDQSSPAKPGQVETPDGFDETATLPVDRGRLSHEAMKRVHAISLAQYAWICAMLTAFPEQVVEIRNRYALDVHAWTALHALWQDRFELDPTLQHRWEALVAAALSRGLQ